MDSPYSAIQRGFDNAVANWPLLLIRIAENVALLVLIVLGILAVVVPIGLTGAFFEELVAENPEEVLEAVLGKALLPALFAVLVFSVILVVGLAIHSFVQAGVIGVYAEGERQAAHGANLHRNRFKVFTPEKWVSCARRDWWPYFIIYNVIWGVWGLILLVPLLVIVPAMWLTRDEPEMMLPLACGGLALVVLLMVVTGFLAHLWCTVAIVLRTSGRSTAAAMGEGWRLTLRRAAPLIVIAIIAIVVSFAAASGVSVGAFGLGIISSIPGFGLVTLPMQVAISFLQSAVSIVVYGWFLAAVVSVVISS